MAALKLIGFLVLLSIFTAAAQQPRRNDSDVDSAVGNMRERSYYGFIMLLQMLNWQTVASRNGITFLIPADKELASATIAPEQIQDFILSHSILTPLYFNNMLHFPTGTLIPTGLPNFLLDITNNGPYDFYLNNAKIVAPNVCQSARIKCHGIDAVIQHNTTAAERPLLPVTQVPKITSPVLQPGESSPLHESALLPLRNENSLKPMLNVLSHTSAVSAGTTMGHNAPLLVMLISFGLLI
ncbi:uncharacterized protein LOC116259516 [Nymphaea colorata]|uniref:FAS1 domain-containing protein n=1 Tax=Nymphaea colorata TaxID=210225 RepID=A0A5K1FSW9_9MAGN|nr:uncharacterized protein LOC116259516 [Nymphaea colorata]